jgi:beta-glucosidase-like glycosyl hydrolase
LKALLKRCETVYRVTFQTGEDPYLNSQFVIEYVSGMQGDPSTSGYLKTMTTCKHFAGFNLGTTIGEDGKFTQAQTFNALISDQDMADTFLPAFRACITEAKGASVMCSCKCRVTTTIYCVLSAAPPHRVLAHICVPPVRA